MFILIIMKFSTEGTFDYGEKKLPGASQKGMEGLPSIFLKLPPPTPTPPPDHSKLYNEATRQLDTQKGFNILIDGGGLQKS